MTQMETGSGHGHEPIPEELRGKVPGRHYGTAGTKLLFEDERTRVWLLELEPEDASEWHEHPWDYVFVVDNPGKVRLEYEDGEIEDQDDFLGDVVHRRRGKPHRLVNKGDHPYRNVVIEFIGQRPPQSWPPAESA
jgi:quercetin dioxygenase-like cupin family protein